MKKRSPPRPRLTILHRRKQKHLSQPRRGVYEYKPPRRGGVTGLEREGDFPLFMLAIHVLVVYNNCQEVNT
jgi:hypothetical protein